METDKDFRSGVFFISDIHASHKNILKYSPRRMEIMGLESDEDMEKHDDWLVDMILSQTKRGDRLYMCGDIVLANQEKSKKFLERIKKHGLKLHLIRGNHDRSIQHMYNMFESISDIKVLNFHKKEYPFLLDDFQCVLCHFPIISWFNKARGSAMVYGHVHQNSPQLDETPDLMFNVGLDAPLSEYNLISLEKLYEAYRKKIDLTKIFHDEFADKEHITPKEYIDLMAEKEPSFIK